MIAYNVNDTRNYSFINEFTKEHIFENNLLQLPIDFIIRNSEKISIDDTYKYRPDKLAYEYYGDDMYYPWILQANSIGSILNFIPSQMDYEVFVPNRYFVDNFYRTYTHQTI